MTKWLVALGAIVTITALAPDALASGMRPTRYLNYNGVRLAVYESSGCESPSVLMMHGNTSSANSYAEIFDTAFARRHHVVAFDFAGYGDSDNAPSYNAGYYANQVAFVAQQTGTADGIIVGWSLGGDIALQASGQLPNAKGYFVFGTAPLGVAPGLPPAFLSPSESYAGQAVTYGLIGNLTTEQVDDYVTAFFRPNYRHIPRAMFLDGRRTDPATRTAIGFVAAGQDPTFQDELVITHNLTVPLAMVLGTEDAYINPAYMTAVEPMIPRLYRGQTIEVKNAGHAIQWEYPGRFTALLSRFARDTTGCEE